MVVHGRAKLPVHDALDYVNILNVTFNIGNLEPLKIAQINQEFINS